MENGQFYLHLPSNSSMDIFPENTLSEYRVQLPQLVQVSEDWEVAMVEIQYPHTWNTVHEGFWSRIYVTEYSSGQPNNARMIEIPAGHYNSIEAIVETANELFQSLEPPFKNKFRLTYDKLSRKVTVRIASNMCLIFAEIGELLGFKKEILYKVTTEAEREADLENGFHNLYIYCDIIQSQLVGDSQVPLLRIVPVEGKDGERVNRSFLSPQYLPISKKEFDTIEVNIKRDTGEKVPFEAGRVLITLHFRKAIPYF